MFDAMAILAEGTICFLLPFSVLSVFSDSTCDGKGWIIILFFISFFEITVIGVYVSKPAKSLSKSCCFSDTFKKGIGSGEITPEADGIWH